MSSLRPPALGPVVGHTTSSSCRLWIRGADPADSKSSLAADRRTLGVLTVLNDGKADSSDPGRSSYFRLHREFDRTGTFNLGKDRSLGTKARPFKLQEEKEYSVRMGTIALDDSRADDENVSDDDLVKLLPRPSVWAEELARLPAEQSEAIFRTFPENSGGSLKFLLGSCRYPGILWKKKRADRIFGPMLDRAQFENARFVLMVGDQIYADMFNRSIPIGLADTFEEFQERYHQAFGSQRIRRLLRQLPTYMMLDDHEIEDNWTQDRIQDRKKRVLFQLAIGAYMSYQWVHSPRNFGTRLFYSFDCAGFPFFVLDERTQRYKGEDEDLEDNHLLGRPSLDPAHEPSQLDHLCRWLSNQQAKKGDLPKFIASPTVFVPNTVTTLKSDRAKNKDDSWAAFPTTRRKLLDHIVGNQIQNVVFLSGDIHCSNLARIWFSGSREAEQLRAFSVTSSAFYWPFPFSDGEPSEFVHNSTKPDQEDTFELSDGITMDYEAHNFIQENNFTQVETDWAGKKLKVRVFDTHGLPLPTRVSELDLA